MTDLPKLTDRQRTALDKISDELQEKWALSDAFDLAFEEETRPGRGHTVTWWCSDGERVAQGRIDIYGNYDGYGVGDLEWIHGGVECECEQCAAELTAEEGA